MTPLAAIPTPALLIDAARCQHNLQTVLAKAQQLGVQLRPHFKTHKCWEIALQQMTSPEGPVTVSTLLEAKFLAEKGVKDILYAVSIAPQKLTVVDEIRALGVDLKIIVDSVEMAKCISLHAKTSHRPLSVLIEVDCDGHRSGVPYDSPLLLDVAAALMGPAKLVGVMTHAGASYDCPNAEAIREAARHEAKAIAYAADFLRRAGYPISIVSMGSTPTVYAAEACSGVTEIRCGVYAFFDLFMHNLGVCSLDQIAISVLATVIGHQPEKHQLIVDAGWMAMSRDRGTARQRRDFGYGLVCDESGAVLEEGTLIMKGANQEHGLIEKVGEPLDLSRYPIGTRLRILPNHACPTAAPHAHLWWLEGDKATPLPHLRGW